MKISPLSLALTGGILMGIYVLGFTWISVWSGGYGKEFLEMWVPLHPGYSVSIAGGIVGFVYAFIEGFIWLFVGGHIYNFFLAAFMNSGD